MPTIKEIIGNTGDPAPDRDITGDKLLETEQLSQANQLEILNARSGESDLVTKLNSIQVDADRVEGTDRVVETTAAVTFSALNNLVNDSFTETYSDRPIGAEQSNAAWGGWTFISDVVVTDTDFNLFEFDAAFDASTKEISVKIYTRVDGEAGAPGAAPSDTEIHGFVHYPASFDDLSTFSRKTFNLSKLLTIPSGRRAVITIQAQDSFGTYVPVSRSAAINDAGGYFWNIPSGEWFATGNQNVTSTGALKLVTYGGYSEEIQSVDSISNERDYGVEYEFDALVENSVNFAETNSLYSRPAISVTSGNFYGWAVIFNNFKAGKINAIQLSTQADTTASKVVIKMWQRAIGEERVPGGTYDTLMFEKVLDGALVEKLKDDKAHFIPLRDEYTLDAGYHYAFEYSAFTDAGARAPISTYATLGTQPKRWYLSAAGNYVETGNSGSVDIGAQLLFASYVKNQFTDLQLISQTSKSDYGSNSYIWRMPELKISKRGEDQIISERDVVHVAPVTLTGQTKSITLSENGLSDNQFLDGQYVTITSVVALSDGRTLSQGTDYSLDPENGRILAIGSNNAEAVTVTYDIHQQRYDRVVYRPDTAAVQVLAGTDRGFDPINFIAPENPQYLETLFIVKVRSDSPSTIASPLFKQKNRYRVEFSSARDEIDRHNARVNQGLHARIVAGVEIGLDSYGNSIASWGPSLDQSTYPMHLNPNEGRDLVGFLSPNTPSDVLSTIPQYSNTTQTNDPLYDIDFGQGDRANDITVRTDFCKLAPHWKMVEAIREMSQQSPLNACKLYNWGLPGSRTDSALLDSSKYGMTHPDRLGALTSGAGTDLLITAGANSYGLDIFSVYSDYAEMVNSYRAAKPGAWVGIYTAYRPNPAAYNNNVTYQAWLDMVQMQIDFAYKNDCAIIDVSQFMADETLYVRGWTPDQFGISNGINHDTKEVYEVVGEETKRVVMTR